MRVRNSDGLKPRKAAVMSVCDGVLLSEVEEYLTGNEWLVALFLWNVCVSEQEIPIKRAFGKEGFFLFLLIVDVQIGFVSFFPLSSFLQRIS